MLGSTKTDLLQAVIDVMAEHGIEMPYQQLDVHLYRAGDGASAGGLAPAR